jgi:hypothetical protein
MVMMMMVMMVMTMMIMMNGSGCNAVDGDGSYDDPIV